MIRKSELPRYATVSGQLLVAMKKLICGGGSADGYLLALAVVAADIYAGCECVGIDAHALQVVVFHWTRSIVVVNGDVVSGTDAIFAPVECSPVVSPGEHRREFGADVDIGILECLLSEGEEIVDFGGTAV